MESVLMPVSCFAPELTEIMLRNYEELIDDLPSGELKDGLDKCLTCVKAWWKLPESKRTDGRTVGIRHRGKDITFKVTPLEEAHIKSLWDVTPYPRECKPLQELFETISNETEKKLRDCAHHLLWHVIEIANDREPLTQTVLN